MATIARKAYAAGTIREPRRRRVISTNASVDRRVSQASQGCAAKKGGASAHSTKASVPSRDAPSMRPRRSISSRRLACGSEERGRLLPFDDFRGSRGNEQPVAERVVAERRVGQRHQLIERRRSEQVQIVGDRFVFGRHFARRADGNAVPAALVARELSFVHGEPLAQLAGFMQNPFVHADHDDERREKSAGRQASTASRQWTKTRRRRSSRSPAKT